MKAPSFAAKALLAILLLFAGFFEAKATDLNPGDLLFTGYLSNATTTDSFSFIILTPLSGTTVISFTDAGWTPGGTFTFAEQTITWTYTGTLQAGREITISGPSAGGGVAVLSGSFITIGSLSGSVPSFSNAGDQIIAYRGTAASPTFIAGLHMNVYAIEFGMCDNTTAAAWDPTCITANTNSSVMPPGLTNGFSAAWIGREGVGASESDNAKFGCLPASQLLTAAQVRAALTNPDNWLNNSIAPPAFTIPSRCAFMGLVGFSTAGEVSVGGRVATADGRALGNTVVTITDQNGRSLVTRTSHFGYYRFDDVEAGRTYTVSASGKGFNISPRILSIGEDLSGLDLVADPQ